MHFGIASPLYTSPENSVTLALTGSWGSSKYMQTYYGVSAAQSAASGFARHDAGSGIYAYSLNPTGPISSPPAGACLPQLALRS